VAFSRWGGGANYRGKITGVKGREKAEYRRLTDKGGAQLMAQGGKLVEKKEYLFEKRI